MLNRRDLLIASVVGTSAGLLGGCSARASSPTSQDVVALAVEAAETEIDLGGVVVRTWAWGGRVPGSEIRIRRGQTLRADVTNRLPKGTTIHWHGLAIPNDMDGVPVLTQPEIAPGQSFRYEFVVPDAGTYYRHSHVGTQLDRGLYGPVIIEDPDEPARYDDELVVVLDDWIDGTGTTPDVVLANLKKNGMASMGDTPDPNGGVTPTTPLGLDGGDVTYPYFLVNGRVPADPSTVDYRAGHRIRLRIINAGADSAFRVAVPGHALTVTHTDGYPVVAREVESVILGMGERVDATITLGEVSVPLVAAPERKVGHAQLNLRVNKAPVSGDLAGFIAQLRNSDTLDTAFLRAAQSVQLSPRAVDQTLELNLQGPLDGYHWPINGELYDPPQNGLAVKPAQRVRMRYVNTTLMYHPMHFHGHTFQVQGPDGPAARKDTVLVPPKQEMAVDFDTNNPGRWINHCHNDYHLNAGMATFIEYTD